jgi:hypothetical protein
MKHLDSEAAVVLANSIPPLMQADYTRLEESVSKEFRWYLIGLTCLLANDKSFQSDVLNNQLTRAQIAKNCGCAEETIRRFMYYTNVIFRLQKIFPELASDILKGKSRLGLKATLRLAKLQRDDIRAIIKRIETEDTSARRIILEQTRSSVFNTRNISGGKRNSDSLKTVKDKPRYDPDSQVVGLTYTIPSWVVAVHRIYTSDTLYGISDFARVNLSNELQNLKNATHALMISIVGV